MNTILMIKKIIPQYTLEDLEDLIKEIPLEQRKRIARSKAYREGWLDATMFWKIQFHNTFERSQS